jgi:uncharacterized membrane protein
VLSLKETKRFGEVVRDFDGVSWLYTILTGIFVVLQQVCRFIALQNCQAAKLQKLNFLATIYSFFFDVFLF